MTKEFIPYQQALDLKELGFNERCVAYYTADTKQLALVQGYSNLMFADYVHLANTVKSVPCPLYQQAFRWFREKYALDSYIRHEAPDGEAYYDIVIGEDVFDLMCDTYEEAELACLIKLIEIVKDGKSKSNS